MTEDYEGGWTRPFGVSRIPSAFLLDARRRFLWKDDDEMVIGDQYVGTFTTRP